MRTKPRDRDIEIDRPVGLSYRHGRVPKNVLARCGRSAMFKILQSISAALVLAGVTAGMVHADSYDDAIHTFKEAGKSGSFFAKAYGYAVFPTVGGAGFVIGAAHGKGRVYAHGILMCDTTVNLIS